MKGGNLVFGEIDFSSKARGYIVVSSIEDGVSKNAKDVLTNIRGVSIEVNKIFSNLIFDHCLEHMIETLNNCETETRVRKRLAETSETLFID